MNIKVLGSRGEIKPSAPYHSKHSGMLVDGTMLFDLGERAFLDYHPRGIFITHLHPDHAFFVRDLTALNSIPVYAPEPLEGFPQIELLNHALNVQSYAITPVPTIHSIKVESTAYLVEKDGWRVLYTGDLVWIDQAHERLPGKLDLVVTDGSYIRRGGLVKRDKAGKLYGHNGIPDLVRLFKPFTRHILFVHFGSWFYGGIPAARRALKQLARENGVNIYTGFDGLELDIDRLTSSKF